MTLYARQQKRHGYIEQSWTLWEKVRVGWFDRIALKYVCYHIWNKSPVQVQCTTLDTWGWCTGMTQRDGMGREEGGRRRVQDGEHRYNDWVTNTFTLTIYRIYSPRYIPGIRASCLIFRASCKMKMWSPLFKILLTISRQWEQSTKPKPRALSTGPHRWIVLARHFSFQYMFIWLCWVLVAACRVFSWGMWTLSCSM